MVEVLSSLNVQENWNGHNDKSGQEKSKIQVEPGIFLSGVRYFIQQLILYLHIS